MLKPSVGSILSMSSPQNLRRIVVLPALSNPNISSRTSRSFSLTCYNIILLKMNE